MLLILLILTILFARFIFPKMMRRQMEQQRELDRQQAPPAPVPDAQQDYDLQRRDKIWL